MTFAYGSSLSGECGTTDLHACGHLMTFKNKRLSSIWPFWKEYCLVSEYFRSSLGQQVNRDLDI